MNTLINLLGFCMLGFALPTGFGWQFWLGIAAGITISITSEIKGRTDAKLKAKPYKQNW